MEWNGKDKNEWMNDWLNGWMEMNGMKINGWMDDDIRKGTPIRGTLEWIFYLCFTKD